MKETVFILELTLVAYLKGFTRQIFDTETGQLANLELFAAEPQSNLPCL